MRRDMGSTLLFISVTLGCAGPDPGAETLGRATLAMDVCNETVPGDRNVDGLPAYAQCDETMSASIWSNNGIDTSTSSLGSDWIQTQRGGGYQCTELAYRYMHFRWQVDYRHGDAREWCDGDLPSTLVKSATPAHGDLIVFDGGVCGADATTGHIAVVDVVDASGSKVTLVEENRAGRRSANTSCATCFLHALANDGSAAVGGGGAGGSMTAGGDGGALSGGATASGGRGPAGGGAGEPAQAGRGSVDRAGSAGAMAAGAGTASGGASGMSQAGAENGGATQGGASAGGGAHGAVAGAPAQAAAGRSPASAGGGATEGPDAPQVDDALSASQVDGGCAVARRDPGTSSASLWGLLWLAALRRLRRRVGA